MLEEDMDSKYWSVVLSETHSLSFLFPSAETDSCSARGVVFPARTHLHRSPTPSPGCADADDGERVSLEARREDEEYQIDRDRASDAA